LRKQKRNAEEAEESLKDVNSKVKNLNEKLIILEAEKKLSDESIPSVTKEYIETLEKQVETQQREARLIRDKNKEFEDKVSRMTGAYQLSRKSVLRFFDL
jgi:hypothetical protein